METEKNKRLELDALLRKILRDTCGQTEGQEHCYYDPPEGMIMKYPCIVYERSNTQKVFADNTPYQWTKRYLITVIDKDPDSELPDVLETQRMCTHDRDFTTSNLHHYVFTLFF